MLKISQNFLLLFNIITVIFAAVDNKGFLHNTNKIERCVVDDVSFEPGIYKRPFPNKCMYMYCTPDGVATIANCPKYVAPPKDCEHGEYINPDGDYPKCCRKKIICKDDD